MKMRSALEGAFLLPQVENSTERNTTAKRLQNPADVKTSKTKFFLTSILHTISTVSVTGTSGGFFHYHVESTTIDGLVYIAPINSKESLTMAALPYCSDLFL